MSQVRLVPAPLELNFELDESRSVEFEREFNSVLPNDEDPLNAWLKRVRARGETKDSDQILLTLMVELHRKIDALNDYIKNEQRQYLTLANSAMVEAIGFEHVQLAEAKFRAGERYYARILMPIFPKRNLAFYLRAIDEKTAKIETMHGEDEPDWNAYVTARERVMIRQMRANL